MPGKGWKGNDYYPGGMQMPGRAFSQSSNGYRYGFNGKELDKEDPIQYDYGFRIYDPRLVRFKSVDPLFKNYPWNSPYSYAEGDVIRSVDLDGLEKAVVSLNDNTITFKITTAVFTNRPDKAIKGVTYQGGNMPESCTNAVEIIENNYNVVNAALKSESYPLTIKSTARNQRELFGAIDDPKTNKNFTVKYDVKVLTFKDEDEMKASDSYINAFNDGSFAGVTLFGKKSYATVNGKESVVELGPNDGGITYGISNNKYTNRDKAYLIDNNQITDGSVQHEHGHGMGLNHDTEPENSASESGVKAANGSTYGKYGVMGLNKDRTPQAPTRAEVKEILNTIKGEIIK